MQGIFWHLTARIFRRSPHGIEFQHPPHGGRCCYQPWLDGINGIGIWRRHQLVNRWPAGRLAEYPVGGSAGQSASRLCAEPVYLPKTLSEGPRFMTVSCRVHALGTVSPCGPFVFHFGSILWGLVLGLLAPCTGRAQCKHHLTRHAAHTPRPAVCTAPFGSVYTTGMGDRDRAAIDDNQWPWGGPPSLQHRPKNVDSCNSLGCAVILKQSTHTFGGIPLQEHGGGLRLAGLEESFPTAVPGGSWGVGYRTSFNL